MLRTFVVFIVSLCVYLVLPDAYALPNCDLTEQDCINALGCEWKSYGCTHCNDNTYYDNTTHTCKACGAGKHSAAGSVNGESDCESNEKSCDTVSSLHSVCDNNGTVSGTAQWDDNNGRYNYNTCTCAQSGVVISHGTVSRKCKFSSDGTSITTDCSEVQVTSCDSGYCAQSGACASIPVGSYSIDTSAECKTCPYGSTSDGGTDATRIDRCYFTKVCDKHGCHTLGKAYLSSTLKKLN